MFKKTKAFSSFSVNDLKAARKFYGDTLELDVEEIEDMPLLRVTAGSEIMIYEKPDHAPATFTVLVFRQEGYLPEEEYSIGLRRGWSGFFDRLAEHLAEAK